MKRLVIDENAVSLSIGFILTFSITVLVLVTILTSFYSLMGQAEQTIMRDEFEIHGNDIAVQIAAIDTLVGSAKETGSTLGILTYELTVPDRIAGEIYSVEFANQTEEIIFISEEREETRVKIPYSTEDTTVISSTLHSSAGRHQMVYDPVKNTIEIS
ncbi:hypothetical protein V7O66_11715 [Methanolobus sp. ZRKC3]|uniref:DUF7266 family protein n=1 Tax=Methanolobus sp. ZRKC3 TaxID=3125786 RepID=UPI003243A465